MLKKPPLKIYPVSTLVIALCASQLAHAASSKPFPDGFKPSETVPGLTAYAVNVLRAQVLLDRAHFSPGEIDAAYGDNLQRAILGFQKAQQLEATGGVDDPTWSALESDDAPILTEYTISEADAAGPFVAVPASMADKARLSTLGYANPAEALGEKFHASPALLKRLNPGKDLSRAGEQITVPNLNAASALPKAAMIVVTRSAGTLSLLDASGAVIAQFPASTGSAHDPLPLGTWKVEGIARNPVYQYNPALFWDANPADARARIPAGPNNPVGVVWIALSKKHYGIHGTPEPSSIGKTESHGCIRLTNWDARTVAAAVMPAVPIVLQE